MMRRVLPRAMPDTSSLVPPQVDWPIFVPRASAFRKGFVDYVHDDLFRHGVSRRAGVEQGFKTDAADFDTGSVVISRHGLNHRLPEVRRELTELTNPSRILARF